jgi:dTDP-4-amino-4,6-dideoxygalactose transaminase
MYKNYIKFNVPFVTKNQLSYLKSLLSSRSFSGNNVFTKKCQAFLENKFKYNQVLLTTSCTDALEMSAILANIKYGDEVIIPSYTFVSTANAFALRGAKIIFADSSNNNPNINITHLTKLINKNTRCVVIVHYAGIACDMKKIMHLKKKFKFFLIEDCAHSINSKYQGKFLGSFGDVSTLSFHETKNIQCGEGGALVINNIKLAKRAKIIWEKGTNRDDFIANKVKKYEWVDIGSSFLPNEITAAFLFKQLQNLNRIQKKRCDIWKKYNRNLKYLEKNNYLFLPFQTKQSTINGHIFYLILKNKDTRIKLQNF